MADLSCVFVLIPNSGGRFRCGKCRVEMSASGTGYWGDYIPPHNSPCKACVDPPKPARGPAACEPPGWDLETSSLQLELDEVKEHLEQADARVVTLTALLLKVREAGLVYTEAVALYGMCDGQPHVAKTHTALVGVLDEIREATR